MFPADLKELLSEPDVVFNTDNYALPTTQQVQEGRAVGFFPTPKPKGFTKITPYEHRWISELRIDGHVYPRHPDLGEWLVQHQNLSSQEVRVGSRGISYCCPNSAYFGGDVDTIHDRPQLFVPSAAEVFERLAKSCGWTSKLSDKGFYSHDTIAKFGDWETTAASFRDTARFAIITEYLCGAKHETAGGNFLDSDRRRYLDLAAITKHLGQASAADSLIDELLAKRILHRGLVLKCDYCRGTVWFPLADLGTEFTCKRCRRAQPILSRHALKQTEPAWYYQFDEVAYQGVRNDMHVPLLALDYLRRGNAR